MVCGGGERWYVRGSACGGWCRCGENAEPHRPFRQGTHDFGVVDDEGGTDALRLQVLTNQLWGG